MAYSNNLEPDELTALTSLDSGDVFVVGDTSDANEPAKHITKTNLITVLSASFEPKKGADDNYVTDAEKIVIGNTSNTNTGDQTRDSLGIDTDDSPQFAGINLGHASDTTLTRSSAGVVAVEGTPLATTTITDGKENYHGMQAYGTLSFNNTTHVVQLAAGTNTYWYQGVKYTTASAITCDLDSYVTWSSWYGYYGSPSWTSIDKIRFADEGNNGSGTGTMYYDAISPNYTISSGTTFTPRVSFIM